MSRVVRNAIADPANARSRRTRAALLDAARAVVEEEGFAALTMARAAALAGVTRRAAYLHFPSRTDLVTALFDHLSRQECLADSLGRVWSAPDAQTALTEWAAHVARYHPRILAVDRAAAAAADTDPDAARHRAQVNADQLAACRQIAGQLASAGILARPWTADSAAELLWGLLSPDLITRLTVTSQWNPGDFAERLAVLLHRTLTTGSTPPFPAA
jgi:AcrR family transcriptional regulator